MARQIAVVRERVRLDEARRICRIPRAGQVLELTRIPYTKVDYRFESQDYVFYVYDSEGKEKFYADRYPARWDRIERLVRSISNDLMTPAPAPSQPNSPNPGYRVPIEVPPYTITEEDEEPHNS